MQSDIAFLAYYPEKKRSDNNSFEGNYNIGANVIKDVLKRRDSVLAESGRATKQQLRAAEEKTVDFISKYQIWKK